MPSRNVAWAVGLVVAHAAGLASSAQADSLRSHEVHQGETLIRIAHQYGVPVQSLVRTNKLSSEDVVRAGQRLLIPAPALLSMAQGVEPQAMMSLAEGKSAAPMTVRKSSAGKARSTSLLTLVRPADDRRVRLIIKARGSSVALSQLANLMRHKRTLKVRKPHPRLLQLLAKVSNHFAGKPIHLISGYRPAGGRTRKTSRHTRGRAVDIRVEGIPNRVLRDYCRTLPNVGVGYYPNSTFVHLDVRDERGYWVDYSSPGQSPRYGREAVQERFASSNHADDENGEVSEVEHEQRQSPLEPSPPTSEAAAEDTAAAVFVGPPPEA